MHEIGIASSILESVASQEQRHPGTQILGVGVRIGELSGVDKDALAFAFEALTRDTQWQNLKLYVEWCPRRQQCLTCGHEFLIANLDLTCPQCGANCSTCISGAELDIAYLDLEDEPCAKS